MPSCSHPANRQIRLFCARDYITGDVFSIERCADCGVAFTRPVPSPAELSRYYPAGYYGAAENRFPGPVEKLQRTLYARRARFVERALGRTGRVLDIGCGSGFLLRAFRDRGWTVQGTEFSGPSARRAREILGLPVAVGDLVGLQFPASHFDAIVMWHVLEHVSDPHTTLAEVARILKPGGLFLCAVPNFGSFEARLARDKWFHLDVPRHLSHFTVPALTTILRESGFTVERKSFTAIEYDSFSFTQSALNRLGLRHNLLYNFLRGSSAKILAPSPVWQTILSVILAAPLGILSLPATLAAALLRSGATVTVVARRAQPP